MEDESFMAVNDEKPTLKKKENAETENTGYFGGFFSAMFGKGDQSNKRSNSL